MANVGESLTSAIEAGDFAVAARLVSDYGDQLKAVLQSSAPHDREKAFQLALGDLQQKLDLARVVRSHISAHLTAVTGEALYLESAPLPHCWEVEG